MTENRRQETKSRPSNLNTVNAYVNAYERRNQEEETVREYDRDDESVLTPHNFGSLVTYESLELSVILHSRQ